MTNFAFNVSGVLGIHLVFHFKVFMRKGEELYPENDLPKAAFIKLFFTTKGPCVEMK